jgi:glycosyltransferase involved in cell wall biosynthesis
MLRRPAPDVVIDPGSVSAVHQFLPALLPGDACGLHTLQAQAALRDAGFESEIFCEAIHHQLEGRGRHFSEFPSFAKGSVMIYHLATGSVLADFVNARPEPLVVDYHNLTPAEFFRRWDPTVANAVSWGRSQLAMLSSRTALGLADSAFNELELIELGYRRTAVVPILLDVQAHRLPADAVRLAQLQDQRQDGGGDLLFVGRLAPNKAQQDLVKALVMYRRAYDPKARLRLIGRPAAASYEHALREFVTERGLQDAVIIDGGISDAELAAHYEAADVLVVLSEHEGFNTPLVEAMRHDLPIVAFASCAVPETLGAAGILLSEKSPGTVAAAVHRVVSDPAVRQVLIAAGRKRLRSFDLELSKRRLIEALVPVTGVVPRH